MKTPSLHHLKRGFTLIELLVVIAIIAVLAAAGFAVGTAALTKAKKLTAQSAATSIEQAVNAFYSEYGTFPVDGTNSELDTSTSTSTVFLQTLIGKNVDLNPRGISFLSVKEGKSQGSGGVDGLVFEDGGSIRGLYDPWGNGYTVVLDSDFEEQLTFTTPDGKSVTLNGRRVAVYSPGVDEGEEVNTTNLVKTW